LHLLFELGCDSSNGGGVKKDSMVYNVTVVGLWHQGIVGSACLADSGFCVNAADTRQGTIDSLKLGVSPIFEPGLDDLLEDGLKNKRLSFTSDLTSAVKDADFVLLMQDTPVDEQDRVDDSDFWKDVETILPFLQSGTVIYVTAQVPVGTCERLQIYIREYRPNDSIFVAYSPENLRLGQALELFLNPALPVIGVDDPNIVKRLKPILDVFKKEFKIISLSSAEMTKHALNTFLALSVSFGNELGLLCDETGANAVDVAQCLRMEPRVGSKAMLYPGMAFSGGTLARDTQTLRNIGTQHKVQTRLLDGLWNSNQSHNDFIFRRLEQELGNFAGKTIAILGLTYKSGTSTLRRSASVAIARLLQKAGAIVKAHDPQADVKEVSEAGLHRLISVNEAVQSAEAVLLLTTWPEYKELDFKMLASKMSRPILIDAQNYLDPKLIRDAGFIYHDIGRGGKY
jgi:UDPglucose 6-dehydrogenase